MRIAQESLNFGAYDYLSKPVNTDDLLDVIDRAAKSIKQNAEHKHRSHARRKRHRNLVDGFKDSAELVALRGPQHGQHHQQQRLL